MQVEIAKLMTVAMRVLAQPCSASSTERVTVWSSYGHVHTDSRNRLSKERAKKLVIIGRTVEKALQLDWESQTFLWDESEQGADTSE